MENNILTLKMLKYNPKKCFNKKRFEEKLQIFHVQKHFWFLFGMKKRFLARG